MRLNVLGWTSLQFFDHTYGNSTSLLASKTEILTNYNSFQPKYWTHAFSQKMTSENFTSKKPFSSMCSNHSEVVDKSPKLNHFFYTKKNCHLNSQNVFVRSCPLNSQLLFRGQ